MTLQRETNLKLINQHTTEVSATDIKNLDFHSNVSQLYFEICMPIAK